MATMRYSFFSQVLSLCTDVTITYPDRQFDYCESPRLERIVARERRQALRPGMKLQTVYVLHGGSDDDTLIHRYTNLERYAEENCVMTVTPQVKDSFFIDTKYGFRYYTYLTEPVCFFAPAGGQLCAGHGHGRKRRADAGHEAA